jgi:hypothetical protein
MGERVEIRLSRCQFSRLVQVVETFGNQGLWGCGLSINTVGIYTLLFDTAEDCGYTYQRVRVFKHVKRACTELVLSAGGIPNNLNLSEQGFWEFGGCGTVHPHERLLAEVVEGQLPPEGYWQADYSWLQKKWAEEAEEDAA